MAGTRRGIPDERLDWDSLSELVGASNWSDSARTVGIWALQALSEQLGPGWPDAWQRRRAGPPELLACWYSMPAYASMLDLALGFHMLRDAPGMGRVRKAVRSATRPDQLASPRLQLRIGCLAAAQGARVELEPTLLGRDRPVDLSLERGGTEIVVEALAVLRDAKTVAAVKWWDSTSLRLLMIAREHRVDVEGAIDAPLNDQATERLLSELGESAPIVARQKESREARAGEVRLRLVPTTDDGGRMNVRLPSIAVGQRLMDRLNRKIHQTWRSGADWLVIDSLDHLWHLSSVGRLPLAGKAIALAAFLRDALPGEAHLRGVVLTDGAALTRPDASEDTVELDGGAVALCRRLDRLRARESVIVPLRDDARRAALLWRELLDAERGWLDKALSEVGFETPPELAKEVAGQ